MDHEHKLTSEMSHIPDTDDNSNNNKTDETQKPREITEDVQEFEDSCVISCEAIKQVSL